MDYYVYLATGSSVVCFVLYFIIDWRVELSVLSIFAIFGLFRLWDFFMLSLVKSNVLFLFKIDSFVCYDVLLCCVK